MILLDSNSSMRQPGRFDDPITHTLDSTWDRLKFSFSRENWPETFHLLFVTELSLDGGQTWGESSRSETVGGDMFANDGVTLLTHTSINIPLHPEVDAVPRQLRVWAEMSERVRSAIRVEAYADV